MSGPDDLSLLLAALLGERAAPDAVVRAALGGAPGRRRELAVELACRDVLRFGPELLRALPALGAGAPRAVDALATDPLLALEPRRPERAPAGADGEPGVQAAFAPARVRAYLAALFDGGAADRARRLDRLDRWPGLHRLAARSPESPASPAVRAELDARWGARLARRFPPQVSIVPSWSCNRDCAFCFAPRAAPGDPGIPAEEALAIYDAVTFGRGARLGLFGGEPTLWPGLPALLRGLAKRGARAYFSTNGICRPERLRDALRSGAVDCVTLHVDRLERYRAGEWDALLATAGVLARATVPVVVRTVLVDAEARAFEHLDAVLDAVPNAAASFAIALPAVDGSNAHVPVERLASFAPKVIALVGHLARRRPRPPRIVLAKPFPLCAFTAHELVALLRDAELHNVCELDRSGFTDQLHVQPDRTVTPCMALRHPELTAPAPRAAPELGAWFATRLAALVETPLLDACRACALFTVGACQAACYAYAPPAARPEEPVDA